MCAKKISQFVCTPYGVRSSTAYEILYRPITMEYFHTHLVHFPAPLSLLAKMSF